ncbi:MAG TPA: cupin domain-containing protein [Planctomycetota bacterium]|jgi:quercetin dioxygenase-like cupin family protein|nr:cupin domain-containing protein [Planctomycetota bacterium]
MATPTHIVPKDWGEEHWIVNGSYCGKKLVLRRGHRCSLHYHKVKDEVFYVIQGKVLLEVGGDELILEPGDHRHVAPGTVHRFTGIDDSEIIEFSTHHEDSDSYRVEKGGAIDLHAIGLV